MWGAQGGNKNLTNPAIWRCDGGILLLVLPHELARRQTHWRGNGKLHRKPIVVRKYRQTSFGNVTRRMIGLFSCSSLSPARCICSLKVCVCFLVSPRGNKPWPGFAVAFFDGLAYCVLCKHNLSARTLAHRTGFQNPTSTVRDGTHAAR